MSRATAVTILVFLGGYTLLLTVTFDATRPRNKRTTKIIEQRRVETARDPQDLRQGEDLRQPCTDRNDLCETWKKEGQCLSNPGFMLPNCWKACGGCRWKPLQSVSTKVKLSRNPTFRQSRKSILVQKSRYVGQVNLNNGATMPRVGFGTAGLGTNTKQATLWALQAGYRMLDSAQVNAKVSFLYDTNKRHTQT
jgi:ShK domain-like